MNGAQFWYRLSKTGCDPGVWLPGGAIMPVYDALYDGGLAHQLCRHEQGAAMAAVGYARASGQVGSASPPLAPAPPTWSPASRRHCSIRYRWWPSAARCPAPPSVPMPFREVDVLGMSLSCTKHSFMVTDPADLGRVIAEAFAIATEGRPGPVLIDLPKDVQLAAVPSQSPLFAVEEPTPESGRTDGRPYPAGRS